MAHEDLALGAFAGWVGARQSGSNNDPTTAEDSNSLNDQIRLQSWTGKKSMITPARPRKGSVSHISIRWRSNDFKDMEHGTWRTVRKRKYRDFDGANPT
jgi:hypothetical protein